MNSRRVVPLLLLLLLAWLVVEPLALVAVDAVRENGTWTLAAVRSFLVEPNERLAAWNSLWLAGASVVLGACIGVPLALLTGLVDFPGRRVVGVLLALPAVLPPLVGVVAFLFLYGESGALAHLVMAITGAEKPPWRFEGAGAVLLIHATTMYVYTYLLVRGALASFDPALIEAATSLGASRWRAFRTVVFPLLRPAIGNGALLTALTSLASFSAPYVFGGGFRVLPTQLVSTRLNGDVAVAMVETLVLVAFSLVALQLASRLGGPATRGAGKGIAPAPSRRRSAASRWGFAAVAWLATALAVAAASVAVRCVDRAPMVPGIHRAAHRLDSRRTTSRWWPIPSAGGHSVPRSGWRGWRRLPPRSLPWPSRWRLVIRDGVLRAGSSAGTGPAVGRPGHRLCHCPGHDVFAPATRSREVRTDWHAVAAAPGVSCAMTADHRAVAGGRDPRARPLAGRGCCLARRGAWRNFATITLPLLVPVLAGAAALAFVTGLGDFMTSVILYTYDTRPVSMEILGAIRDGDIGIAAAYGVVLTLLSAAAFLLSERRSQPA